MGVTLHVRSGPEAQGAVRSCGQGGWQIALGLSAQETRRDGCFAEGRIGNPWTRRIWRSCAL